VYKRQGFKGYVVSDCGAVSDIYRYHKIVETVEEASALAVKNGCDLNCGDSYSSLLKAVENGLIDEAEIDVALRRLLLARVKLGLFNQLEDIPFEYIGEEALESEAHSQLALQAAKESIVLLKNENNILPLSKELKSVALIGPNANDRHFLLGNYFGVPSERSTVLDGLEMKLSKETELHYFKGVNIADDKEVFDVVGAELFQGDIKTEYFDNPDFEGDPIAIENNELIDFEWGGAAPVPDLKPGSFSIRYSGHIKANYSGVVSMAVMETGGSYKLFVDDEMLVEGTSATEHVLKPGKIKLKKGKTYHIRVDYSCTNEWMASVQLMWNQEAMMGKEHMMDVVNESDVVVFVGGITARLEGEEMPVAVDGFYKGDRTNLKLPKAQHELLKELKATGKPVVFVMTTGSALAINWEQENLDAIISVWYPGQAGGEAIANVLLGNYNPSGKLPITFYKSVNDLPDFEEYNMKGRTYRYFEGDVLYPFGSGLSYTDFSFSKPHILKKVMGRNEAIPVSVIITNTGNCDGETVVQLYVKDLESSVATPIKSLRKFKKVFVKKGESIEVEFTITDADLSIVNNEGISIVEAGEFEIFIGENSATNNKLKFVVQ
jgi:beta-glucosidase